MRTGFIIFIILLVCSALATANDNHQDASYRLAGGISIKELSFDVYEKGSTDSLGTLTEGLYPTLFIHAGSPYRYFTKNTNWGYYFEYGLSLFEISEQEVGLNEVNMDTSVQGGYFYLTPTLIYNIGQKAGWPHTFILGLGVGVGYLKAEGDIILTETSSKERHEIDIDDFGYAVSILGDIKIDRYLIRLRASSPEVDKGDYTYNITEVSIDFGYVWEL